MRKGKKRLEPAGARWRWKQPDVARGRGTRRDGDAPAWTDNSTKRLEDDRLGTAAWRLAVGYCHIGLERCGHLT
jgi:hypothetical protein